MDLSRLLHPRTVAVVGATDRHGSYAGADAAEPGDARLPRRRLGRQPPARGGPRRSRASRRCRTCPSPPDAVVMAIPAAGVPAAVEEAGALGLRRGRGLRRRLRRDGRGAVAGNAAEESEAAPERASRRSCGRRGATRAAGLRAQRQRHRGAARARGALGRRPARARARARGARLPERQRGGEHAGHPARAAAAHGRVLRQRGGGRPGRVGGSPRRRGRAWGRSRSTSRATGDGAALCEALARCAESGVGVAVLKVGSSAAGSVAAAAHTGAVAGDQRVFRALVEEAGAAWAADVHELLELAKAQAVPDARPTRAGGPGGAHLLRRRLRARGRRVRAPGARAAAASAPRPAAGCASGCPARPRWATRSTTPR